MGILEIMTLILFALKLTIHPEWSWWLVATPFIIAMVIYFVIAVLFFLGVDLISKKRRNIYKRK